jgi:hypothetical protein
MHRPVRQQPPPLQLSPAQQASPVPPHFTQMLLWQVVPAPQAAVPRQQGSPGPPQATHEPPVAAVVHRAPGSQLVPQQACPRAPQPEQWPALQLPPVLPHADPEATQVPP